MSLKLGPQDVVPRQTQRKRLRQQQQLEELQKLQQLERQLESQQAQPHMPLSQMAPEPIKWVDHDYRIDCPCSQCTSLRNSFSQKLQQQKPQQQEEQGCGPGCFMTTRGLCWRCHEQQQQQQRQQQQGSNPADREILAQQENSQAEPIRWAKHDYRIGCQCPECTALRESFAQKSLQQKLQQQEEQQQQQWQQALGSHPEDREIVALIRMRETQRENWLEPEHQKLLQQSAVYDGTSHDFPTNLDIASAHLKIAEQLQQDEGEAKAVLAFAAKRKAQLAHNEVMERKQMAAADRAAEHAEQETEEQEKQHHQKAQEDSKAHSELCESRHSQCGDRNLGYWHCRPISEIQGGGKQGGGGGGHQEEHVEDQSDLRRSHACIHLAEEAPEEVQ